MNLVYSPGLAAEQPDVQIMEALGEIGRGESDIDACICVRPGIDQKLAGGGVSAYRSSS